MSASVIQIVENDDIHLVCSIEQQRTKVVISREAFEDCDLVDVEQYSDLTKDQKEMVIANLLVELSRYEASGGLREHYQICGEKLNSLLGE